MTGAPSGPVVLGEDVAFKGWNKLLLVSVITARGTAIRRSVEDHGDAAAVLPFDPERRVALMVRQLRVPLLYAHGVLDSLEAPAGILDEADPIDCARREAMEEAGVAIGAIDPLGAVYPMPGVSTEKMHLFLAEYRLADRIAAGGGVDGENEEIEVLEIPLAELARMADMGELPDLKTLIMVQTLRLRRPALFA